MTISTLDKPKDYSTLSGKYNPVPYVIFWNGNLQEKYVNESNSIISAVNLATSFMLSEGILIENKPNIENFLIKHEGILPYLYQVPNIISHYFKKGEVKLSLTEDPEDSSDYAELFLEVSVKLSPKEATDILSTLNREWLIKSNESDLSFLNVTLNFL